MHKPVGSLRPLAALVALVALVSALAGPVASPVGAQSGSTDDEYNRLLSKLQQTKKKIAEAERKERTLRKDIASADAKRNSLAGDLGELTAQLDDAQGKVDTAESALGRIQQSLEAKTQELQETLQTLQRAHEALNARAVKLYKTGPGSFFDFVLGALDFGDLVNRVEFVGRVFKGDETRIRAIGAAKERVATEREQIATLRQQAAEQVAILARERNRVASLRGAVQEKRRSLDSEVKRKYATLSDVQADKETYLRQQAELEKESARIAAFLKGRSGGKATVSPGGMVWPVTGRISSGFGWRTHPIFGTRKFHAGIDIAAPSGTTVVAAAGGSVIYAGPKGGYGNVVMIDHGGGLATVYAHLGSIQTRTGSQVARGKGIARVGCSGYCTGPHLHFEVRVNGEPQNPMRWL